MVELKLKVGEKGQILIPKVLRDKYGVKEGAFVLLEPRDDGLLVRGRPPPAAVLNRLAQHVSKLRRSGVTGPKRGELSATYLELEFAQETP